MRSRCRCSMCPAIHITSRSWLRSSSTHVPSDPPLGVVSFAFSRKLQHVLRHCVGTSQRYFNKTTRQTGRSRGEGRIGGRHSVRGEPVDGWAIPQEKTRPRHARGHVPRSAQTRVYGIGTACLARFFEPLLFEKRSYPEHGLGLRHFSYPLLCLLPFSLHNSARRPRHRLGEQNFRLEAGSARAAHHPCRRRSATFRERTAEHRYPEKRST